MSQSTCLIIGAGLSGLTAARELRRYGWRVQLVDKGRNTGGRLATRRHPAPLSFDHGAQFFTARSPEFQREVAQWQVAGWASVWFGDAGHERYRSTNGMNGLAARLGEGLAIRLGVTVRSISPAGPNTWAAHHDGGEAFEAGALIVTAPVPQSVALLGELVQPALQAELGRIHYDPCLALLVPLPHPSRVPEPGYLRLENDCLAVISDNTQKGISAGPAAITLHSTADFARAHWESPPDAVAAHMLEAARPHLGEAVAGWQLHRWRYSQPASTFRSPCLAVETGFAPLVLAGDAFGGPRVEGAYLSGLAAARNLLALKL